MSEYPFTLRPWIFKIYSSASLKTVSANSIPSESNSGAVKQKDLHRAEAILNKNYFLMITGAFLTSEATLVE